MIPRLDEFTHDQLQHALDEIVAGIIRLEEMYVVNNYIQHGEIHESDGVFKTVDRYQNLCLWRAQILNAISTVKMREREISN